jgi:hypothetical protein
MDFDRIVFSRNKRRLHLFAIDRGLDMVSSGFVWDIDRKNGAVLKIAYRDIFLPKCFVSPREEF